MAAPRDGTEVPEGLKMGVETMVTGFDYLSQDKHLQEHWLKRFVAVIIDSLIVYVPLMLLGTVIGAPYVFTGFFSGVALFIYSFLLESAVGGTIGKMAFHMKAVPLHGTMAPSQAMLRNLSKVFVLFLFLDWVLGMAVDTRDPRQKWMDQVAHTSVILYEPEGGA